MSYIGIIAAGGAGRRTGLSEYTSKAALRVGGRSLLEHNVDFLRRSGVDRILVACPPAHATLLTSILPDSDRAVTAIIPLPSGGTRGWAGTVECTLAFIDNEDAVLLISCDNYHPILHAVDLRTTAPIRSALFTFTRRPTATARVTDGPVLGSETPARGPWTQRSSDFVGAVFTGYAIIRGAVLRSALRAVPVSSRGEKEFTALLEALWKRDTCAAVPYGGEYIDIADLSALARLDARLAPGSTQPRDVTFALTDPRHGDLAASTAWIGHVRPQIGAGVLLHDRTGAVFLTERQDGLGWVMPGGLVDAGESYAHAAARELREEVGIDVAAPALRLLSVIPTIGKHGGPAASVIFHHRVADRPIVRRDAREVGETGWFDAASAARLTIPFGLRVALDDYFAGRELDCRTSW